VGADDIGAVADQQILAGRVVDAAVGGDGFFVHGDVV
jgi:hypothetical protein